MTSTKNANICPTCAIAEFYLLMNSAYRWILFADEFISVTLDIWHYFTDKQQPAIWMIWQLATLLCFYFQGPTPHIESEMSTEMPNGPDEYFQ